MTARAIAAESKEELYKGRLKDKDQIIEAWKGRAEQSEKQLALSLENRADAGKIFTGDARLLEQANMVIAKQDAEIAKLRNPGWLDTFFDRRTLVGAGIGYLGCKATAGSNPLIQIPNPFGNSSSLQYQGMFITSPEERMRKAMKGK